MKNLKRFIVVALSSLAIASIADAQEIKNEQETKKAPETKQEDYSRRVIINKWYENWEVSARLGTQAYLGEYVHCHPFFKFKDWWTFPAIDLSLSKWGTQSIGLALGFTYSPFKSLYSNSGKEVQYASFAHPSTDEKYYVDDKFSIARGNMGNAYISVIFDVCNIFGGYKKDRFYDLIASLGGGMMFPIGAVTYKNICASFNAGLINKFNISRHWSIDLAIRGTLHDDMFNGISYYTSDDRKNISVDATIGATAGVTYHFNFKPKSAKQKKLAGQDGWTSVNDVAQYTDTYRVVEKEAAEASAAAATATAALAQANEKIKEQQEELDKKATVIVQPFSYKQIVAFTVDSWKLSNREKLSIMLAAEVMKEHPDTKFLVQGYADMQTSNPKHNQFLSEHRSEVVYNCLVKDYGVNPDQLVVSSHGGVDYMFFHDNECSRAVLITAITE